MGEDFVGMVAILLLFGFGPLVLFGRKPLQQWLAQRERREARQLYERLTLEKLDVIKTAVAVGMPKAELAELDMRLEALIGADQMKTLLLQEGPYAPGSEPGLGNGDLDSAALSAAKRRAQRQ